ncbi:MAG: hypothetical protein ACI8RZ_000694 [Myxococcota bacterium]|jgi:hypothetical protein
MERDEASRMATGVLKKVLAARGKLQGNYYYVADGSAKEAVLIATLASKDTKGTRAVNQGRPFRKDIKGSRWSRGTITVDNGKLVFTAHKGTSNKKNIIDGLRKVIAKEKGLAFLKRAVVTTSTATKEEQSSDLAEVETIEEEALTEADSSVDSDELEALIEAQAELDNLNEYLDKTDEELETLYAEEVSEALSRLKELQSQDPVEDEGAQADAWAELASLVSVSRDNLPQLGNDLSPELSQVLQAATTLIDHGNNQEGSAAELKKRLMAGLQDAEQRYFAAGEPEDLPRWILQTENLYKEDAWREGLAMLETEVEWRLVRAERNQAVSEEIADVAEGRVETGQLLLLWKQAYDTANQQMRLFQDKVLSDPEVTADPRFPDIRKKVEALHALIPEPGSLQDSLTDFINASPDTREMRRSEVTDELKSYENQLDADDRLKEIDETAFGTFTVYKNLADAVTTVRKHLSGQ